MWRDDTPLAEAFVEIARLAERLGVGSVSALHGCWEQQIDPHWWIAVNGHKEPVTCSAGVTVPPFSAYVQFNGWVAGIIDPYGGAIAAGAAANEDSFIAALRAASRTAPITEVR